MADRGPGCSYSRELRNLVLVGREKGVSGLLRVQRRELGVVPLLDVVADLGAADGGLVDLAVAEVVAVGEVALVLGPRLGLVGQREEGLGDVVLALHLGAGDAGADDAEEAGVVDL